MLANAGDKAPITVIARPDHNQIEWCERRTPQTHHCYASAMLARVSGRNKGRASHRWDEWRIHSVTINIYPLIPDALVDVLKYHSH